MKKGLAGFVAIVFCIAMAAVLAGCGGSSSSSSASSAASSATASASGSASASAAESASGSASSSTSSNGALLTKDGVDVTKVAVEMVGDTPNLQLVLANNTDTDVEFDLSQFQVMLDDKDEINFHLSKTTVKANTPRMQLADTASPGSLKVGDSVTIYYAGTPLGTFEVGEF